MMSMLMPFSASTMRVRWLHGSLGAENSVMTDRLLDKISLPDIRSAHSTLRGSMHVFPVLLLQEPGEPGEQEKEQHNPYAERTPLHLRRLAHVIEEIDRVTDEAVVLGFAEAARRQLLEANELLVGGAFTAARSILEYRLLQAFELGEHVRHGGSVEPQVVDARGLGRIDIKGFEELVDVVRASRTRHEREIGWSLAEPCFGVGLRQRGKDVIRGLLTRRQQVFLENLLRD